MPTEGPESDPCYDRRAVIGRWILDARLAGGVRDAADRAPAMRSASKVIEGLWIGEAKGEQRFLYDMSTAYLVAYMLAMSNEPDGEIVVTIEQAALAALARRQPEGTVRAALLKAVGYEQRLFNCTLATIGIY